MTAAINRLLSARALGFPPAPEPPHEWGGLVHRAGRQARTECMSFTPDDHDALDAAHRAAEDALDAWLLDQYAHARPWRRDARPEPDLDALARDYWGEGC